jgi:hypothetical protein
MSDAPIDIGQVQLAEEPPEEPPRPRSKLRLVVLSVVLVAAVAGAAVLAWSAYQVTSEKDAKLSAPAQVGSLRLDDSDDGRSTADYLRTALAAEVDLDEAVGAVYRDDSGKNVLFFGGTTLFWTPEKDLDAAFGLISDNEGAVTGLHDVSAGALGGTAKCGTTKSEDGELSVCGWADHGSLALAMFPSRPVAEAAPLLVQIREAAETR